MEAQASLNCILSDIQLIFFCLNSDGRYWDLSDYYFKFLRGTIVCLNFLTLGEGFGLFYSALINITKICTFEIINLKLRQLTLSLLSANI